MNHSLPATQAWRLVVVTYEQTPKGTWLPIVRHEFYGADPDKAWHVYQAHLQSDAFLRECQGGTFGQGVVCRNVIYAPERVHLAG